MKLSRTLFALAAAAGLMPSAQAATVGITGYTNAFTTQPSSNDWSTLSFPPSSSTYVIDVAGIMASVQTNLATSITAQLNASNALPPNAVGPAVWSTNGYVQTRPTGNAYTLLKATLLNATGTNATSIRVNYLFSQPVVATEAVNGLVAFYSLTGEANSWTLIPQLSTNNPGTLTADVTLTAPWNDGSILYLLWVDDNGAPSPDTANQIDNFFVGVTGGSIAPPTVTLTAPTNGATFVQGATVALAASSGTLTTNVSFFVDNVLLSSDTTTPFTATLASCPLAAGPHTAYAVATANGASVASATNLFTLTANTAPTITLTNPVPGTVLVGTAVTNDASVLDDVGVTNVDFYLDGAKVYTRTAAPWHYCYNDSTVGTHTFHAVATDNCGLTTTSGTTSVIVTNPTPDYVIVLPNHSTWKYHATATAPPQDGNGSAWYQNIYEEDSSWTNGVAELGFGDNSPNGATADFYPESTLLPAGFVTYYFRTTFVVADPTQVSNLVVRLLRDDGAVVYVNGQSIWTNNFAAAQMANPITNSTLSAAAGDEGTVYQVFNASPGVLQPGVNHIAVEVHQTTTGSSDVSFDLMLWAQTYTPPSVAITSPTTNQVFGGGCAGLANVTVTAAASFFVYNVSFNLDGGGTLVATNTASPFSVVFANVPVGSHTVVATAMDTANNVVDSAPITFVVSPNQAPIIAITNTYSSGVTGLVYLVGSVVTNLLDVRDTDGTVTNVDWYVNGQLRVRIPTGNNWNTILLNDALAGTNELHAVAVDSCGVTNRSASVFVVATNPPAPVSVIVPNGSVWKYFNTNSAPANDGSGLIWFQPGYADTTWLSGAGELGGGDANHNADANNPETTVIDVGAASRFLAIYFRHEFTVSNPSQYTNLIVRLLRDDGAVVYLNGNPVYTNTMNAGPFTYNTLATAVTDDGIVYYAASVNPTNLVTGANLLAVEVHQDSATSSDLSFDLMLWGERNAQTPNLEIVNNLNGTCTLKWPNTGAFHVYFSNDLSVPRASWALQSGTPTLNGGVWELNVTIGLDNKFFDLRP